MTKYLPRERSAYTATQHYLRRLKYRTDPEPTKRIVRETLEYGEIKNTQDSDRFIFEDERGLHTWRVIVREVPDGVNELLTVYAVGRHDDNHKTVFQE